LLRPLRALPPAFRLIDPPFAPRRVPCPSRAWRGTIAPALQVRARNGGYARRTPRAKPLILHASRPRGVGVVVRARPLRESIAGLA
jgi:hypothetical protein